MSEKATPSRAFSQMDIEFENLMAFIRERDTVQLTEAIKRNLAHLETTNKGQYSGIIRFVNQYKLWGEYDPQRGVYAMAEGRAHALSAHRADFEWLYSVLGDWRSKRILVNILYYWLMSDPQRVEQLCDKTFKQYFDLDIIRCDENEVFVDIGGYIGDTLVEYSKVFGPAGYKRIYCYEIVPANIDYIKKNIALFSLENVLIRQKGAGDHNGTLYLEADTLTSVSQLSQSGTIAVPVTTVDDDIDEPVTFIKMDIEGGEETALSGCLETIRKHHPKLALSVYHNHKDLWKLARMVYTADPTYHFYLRYYGMPLYPTEYVLYAV